MRKLLWWVVDGVTVGLLVQIWDFYAKREKIRYMHSLFAQITNSQLWPYLAGWRLVGELWVADGSQVGRGWIVGESRVSHRWVASCWWIGCSKWTLNKNNKIFLSTLEPLHNTGRKKKPFGALHSDVR